MRFIGKAAVLLAVMAGSLSLCGCAAQRIFSEYADETAYEKADESRLKRMETECAELLSSYPDEDGWSVEVGSGDIPFLADPEYISGCVKEDGVFFKVSTPEELAAACWYVNTQGEADISLCCDIDLSGYQWAPMGWKDRAFTGTVYGNGYTISNMKILRPYTICDAGFIGYEIRSTLLDITFDGAEVSSKDYASMAVAVGDCIGGTLENVAVKNSSVSGSNAGTLVGWDASNSMVNCSVENVTVNGQPCEELTYQSRRDSRND